MTLVEAGGREGAALLAVLAPLSRAGGRDIVGITGLPGGGKSSLIDLLVAAYHQRGNKVGVVAVDPSSPVHGGALLGDRLRLMRHATSPGVIIRSMASRGSLGGLNPAVAGVVSVLAAGGCRPIFVETVGMGQIGWDIMVLADLVIAVTAPGLGDEVQMMKSGLLDIIDLLVLNKADLPGVEATHLALVGEMEHRHLPLIQTSVADGRGIAALVAHIDQHLAATSNGARQPRAERQHLEAEIVERALSMARPILAARVAGMNLDGPPEAMARRLTVELFRTAPANPDPFQQ